MKRTINSEFQNKDFQVSVTGVDREHAHLIHDPLCLLLQLAPQTREGSVGYFDPTARYSFCS
jgi:hypothetical protein